VVPGRRWNDVSEDEPLEVAHDGGAEDLGSAEDRVVEGAMIAADDKSIGIRLLTIPGTNDEV
jgi:hypothetical protein